MLGLKLIHVSKRGPISHVAVYASLCFVGSVVFGSVRVYFTHILQGPLGDTVRSRYLAVTFL